MSHEQNMPKDGAVDQWHSHAGEAPAQTSHGEIHPALIALFGVIGTALVVASMVAIAIYFQQEVRSQVVEVVEGTNVAVDYLERSATWEAELTSYGWIDQESGTVRIPLDAAAQYVSEEYESQR